jgi:hypothetical protein
MEAPTVLEEAVAYIQHVESVAVLVFAPVVAAEEENGARQVIIQVVTQRLGLTADLATVISAVSIAMAQADNNLVHAHSE